MSEINEEVWRIHCWNIYQLTFKELNFIDEKSGPFRLLKELRMRHIFPSSSSSNAFTDELNLIEIRTFQFNLLGCWTQLRY